MIKYECNVCHEIVGAADAWGTGVFVPDPVHNMLWELGRQYQWVTDHRGLMIMPTGEMTGFTCCGSCLGDHLVKMAVEIWPEKVRAAATEALLGMTKDEAKDGEDDPDGDRADSDVPTVQAEPELPEPCTCLDAGSGFNPNCPTHARKIYDNPQA